MANKSVVEINLAPRIKNKIFKIMDIFYRTVFVLLGVDFGFFRHERVPAKLCKLYSFLYLVSIDLSIYFYFFTYRDFWQFTWFFAVVIKFNLFLIRLIYLTDDSTFCNFYKDIFIADLNCGIDTSSSHLEIKILSSSFVWICLKFALNIFYWYNNKDQSDAILLTPYLLMAIGSELVIITYAFIFYAINSRFRIFIDLLVNAESDFCPHQQTYKLYVDLIEKYKSIFDPTIIMSLCCNIPEVLISFYFTLVEWRYHTMEMEEFSLKLQYFFLTLSFTFTLTPAICAGMLSTQVKRIKLTLHDKLMQKRDERAVYEIQRFISYVEARGCQFRVYKLIPLDASLVGMVASFCVTYLIVIIQFTKLY